MYYIKLKANIKCSVFVSLYLPIEVVFIWFKVGECDSVYPLFSTLLSSVDK